MGDTSCPTIDGDDIVLELGNVAFTMEIIRDRETHPDRNREAFPRASTADKAPEREEPENMTFIYLFIFFFF